jgi:hypothetical protein
MFDFYRHGSIWSPTAFNPAKWRINYQQYIGNIVAGIHCL